MPFKTAITGSEVFFWFLVSHSLHPSLSHSTFFCFPSPFFFLLKSLRAASNPSFFLSSQESTRSWSCRNTAKQDTSLVKKQKFADICQPKFPWSCSATSAQWGLLKRLWPALVKKRGNKLKSMDQKASCLQRGESGWLPSRSDWRLQIVWRSSRSTSISLVIGRFFFF